MEPKAFLDTVMEEGQEYSDVINPAACAAHAANESGFGKSGLSLPIANNIFGMKAGSKWGDRPVYELPTEEVTPYGVVVEHARFRKYASWSESIADYARLVERLYPYAVSGRRSAVGFAAGLFLSGPLSYATDPKAFHKVVSIVEDYKLEPELDHPGGSWKTEMVIDNRSPLDRVLTAISGVTRGKIRVTGPRGTESGASKFDIRREYWT